MNFRSTSFQVYSVETRENYSLFLSYNTQFIFNYFFWLLIQKLEQTHWQFDLKIQNSALQYFQMQTCLLLGRLDIQHRVHCTQKDMSEKYRKFMKLKEGEEEGVSYVCAKRRQKKSLKRTAWFIVLLPYTFLYIMYAVCARIHVPIFISEVNDRI